MKRYWRAVLLATVLMLAAVEVVAILLHFAENFHGTLFGSLLDVAVLGGIVASVGLAVYALPDSVTGNRLAGAMAVVVLATVHAAITLFWAASAVTFAVAKIPPPLSVLGEDRDLLASLLESAGSSIGELIGWVLAIWFVHLLVYAIVAPSIVAAGRRLFAVRWRMPPQWPSPVALALLACVGLAVTYCIILPPGYLPTEPVQRSLRTSFMMAPPALALSPPPRPLPPGPPLPHPRPVILIIVDALRPDRMGVYDPRLDTTPFLSGLARDGSLTRIDNAFANCTYSFCGIMGILTSRTWDDFGWAPRAVSDRLRQGGYRTYAVLSGDHRRFGNLVRLYGASMTYVADGPKGKGGNDDREMLDRLSALRFPDPARSFVYLHMMSAHAGSYLMPQYRPAGPNSDPGAMENLYPGPKFALRYDLAVRQADEMIRRAFSILDQKGLLANALIIITADHGERLGEDGRFLHGFNADERTLSVPLLVVDRSNAAYPARPIASLVDIAPTMLFAAGAPVPADMDGIPLQLATPRIGVPYGTAEITGAVVRLGGRSYQFACDRATGAESLRLFGTGQIDGTPIARSAASRQLYDAARAAYRGLHRAGPVNLRPC